MPTYLRVGISGAKGRGVFAEKAFEVGEVLEVCPLIILDKERDDPLLDTIIEEYIYAWMSGGSAVALGFGSLYNHSYESNAAYKRIEATNQLIFEAIRPIEEGDEVTINYNGDPDDKTHLIFDGDCWGTEEQWEDWEERQKTKESAAEEES